VQIEEGDVTKGLHIYIIFCKYCVNLRFLFYFSVDFVYNKDKD